MPTKVTQKKQVPLYENTLGEALRGAGRGEFGTRFDTVPLVVVVEVPDQIATDLESKGQLFQRVLPPLSRAVQALVRDYVAPKLTATQPVDDTLKDTISQILVSHSPRIIRPIEAEIEQHYSNRGEWHALRNSNIKEGSLITVTLSLSAVAFGLSGFTAGVSGAAAIIGLVRGIIDGLEKLITCWKTADEWRVRVNNEISLLNKVYDKSVAGGRATQILGGVSRNSGLGKAVTLVTGRDWTPSIASIEGNVKIYRGKIAHLYTFLDKMTLRLIELLDQQDKLAGSPQAIEKVRMSVSALLGGEGTRRGRLSGFRDRYTIPDGMLICQQGTQAADDLSERLTMLRRGDKHPKLTAWAVKAAEVTTNAGFAAINYPAIFNGPTSGKEAFQLMGGKADITAASFGMFNDAVGTLKDIVEVAEEFRSDSPEAQAKEREVKQAFVSLPGAPPPIRRSLALSTYTS